MNKEKNKIWYVSVDTVIPIEASHFGADTKEKAIASAKELFLNRIKNNQVMWDVEYEEC